VHPFPASHIMPPGHFDSSSQASSPVHATSHAQELAHLTPLLHDSSPEHVTVQRPVPQMTLRQLPWPEHSTRHGVLAGQITSFWQECGAVHLITQTPPWHVPGQSPPQLGGGASGIPASVGGIPPSFGIMPPSFGIMPPSFGIMPPSFGIPASFGGPPPSPGPPVSGPDVASPGGGEHRPVGSAETHQPSAPQTWFGAQSVAAAHRTAHSVYRGS
jgi:hypothetical protein